ncbi:MAG TPA: exosortase N [Saprospiraceae bacterium]|nr:exosortase N [Saprospiraceae bacterium]
MNFLQVGSRQKLPSILLALYAAIILFWMWAGYLRADLTFVAGLTVLLLSVVVRQPGEGSWRFAVPAALCVGLGLAIPARTFHFMALVFSALFVFENWKGKTNEAPVLIALLLTAVVKTMSIVLGFSIRLELSKNAATALRFLGSDAVAEGNIIHFGGKEFSVDPACMGLEMVEVSFLFCFFLLGLFERRTGRHLSLPALVVVVLVVGILNLIFNQLRIIFLVFFDIVPGNPMHDIAGLAGLGLYVFVPAWFGLRWMYRRNPTPGPSPNGRGDVDRTVAYSTEYAASPLPLGEGPGVGLTRLKPATQILLTLFIVWFAATETSQDEWHITNEKALVPTGLPAGCVTQTLVDGVVKYSNDSLLVYVKPIRGWYSTEHTPLICWQGSGYEFGKVWEQKVGETACYAGTLEKKGDDMLYTAWWFDNGHEQTIAQAYWRRLDAGGAPGFSLVNVTARNKSVLENQLEKMLKH